MSQSLAKTAGTAQATAARNSLRLRLLHMLCRRIVCGALTIQTPTGERFTHRGSVAGPEAVLVFHRWRALRRLVLGGDVAIAEAYRDGDWSSPDVTVLIELAARNDASLSPVIDGWLGAKLLNRWRHRQRANTLAGSRRNIVWHYDLGNEFYRLWLDRGMTYSSGLYREPAMTLEAAQRAKQDRVLDLLGLEAGHQVLEIGFGWGGLAERITRLGCQLTGLTLSPSQHAYTAARLEQAGLAGNADLRLADYREAAGRFDRIVSIEMLEAVGEAYWPVFFEKLRQRLKPDGIAVLQVITIADDRFERYRRAGDFIQRYIFPGGMLPSPCVMREQIAGAGLTLQRVETFGLSYARTLRDWRDRFLAALPEIGTLGFPASFIRTWEYYLCYCEAGFRTGAIDVGLWQLTAEREG